MKIIAEIFLDSFGFGWRLDDNQILHTYIIVNRFAKNAKLVLVAENNKPKKQKFGETLLKNELNVLLTRGVKGLYIYAVDPDLQNELLRRQGAKNNG